MTKTITIGSSSSLQVTQSVSTIYETITSTVCTKCVAPPTITPGAPKVPLVASTLPVVYQVGSSSVAASPYSPAKTGIPASTPVSPVFVQSSTSATVPYDHDTTYVGGIVNSYTSTMVVGTVTKTLLPVPEYTPSPASQPIAPVHSPVPVGNVPYPASGNSTAPGSTGASVSGTAPAGTIGATRQAYTGDANKKGMGLMSGVILAAIITALFA